MLDLLTFCSNVLLLEQLLKERAPTGANMLRLEQLLLKRAPTGANNNCPTKLVLQLEQIIIAQPTNLLLSRVGPQPQLLRISRLLGLAPTLIAHKVGN